MSDSTFTGLDDGGDPVAFKSDLVGGVHTPYRKEDADQRAALLAALAPLAAALSAIAPPPTSGDVTIAAGQSLSGALQIDGKAAGIIIPAGWETAAITFMGSADGNNYFPIYDAGVERSIASAAVVAGRMISLNLSEWLHVKYVKIRSGSAVTPVAQTSARVLTLLKVA